MSYYICKRCDYLTNRKSSMVNHYKRQVKCNIINKKYENYLSEELCNMSLQKHYPSSNKTNEYSCNICNKNFTKKFNCNRHMEKCKGNKCPVKNQNNQESKLDLFNAAMSKLFNHLTEINEESQNNNKYMNKKFMNFIASELPLLNEGYKLYMDNFFKKIVI